MEAALRTKQEQIDSLKEAEAETRASRDQPFPTEVGRGHTAHLDIHMEVSQAEGGVGV